MIDASEPSIITMRCIGIYPTESIFLVGSQLHSQTLVLHCTCLCRQSFFANMWILFLGGNESEDIFSCLFIYVSSLENQLPVRDSDPNYLFKTAILSCLL